MHINDIIKYRQEVKRLKNSNKQPKYITLQQVVKDFTANEQAQKAFDKLNNHETH